MLLAFALPLRSACVRSSGWWNWEKADTHTYAPLRLGHLNGRPITGRPDPSDKSTPCRMPRLGGPRAPALHCHSERWASLWYSRWFVPSPLCGVQRPPEGQGGQGRRQAACPLFTHISCAATLHKTGVRRVLFLLGGSAAEPWPRALGGTGHAWTQWSAS